MGKESDSPPIVGAAAASSRFPSHPEEFDADTRISFSKVSQKFILETEEGEEYEYDNALKRWVPVLDDALLEKQQEAYAVQHVDDDEVAKPAKKRKNEDGDDLGHSTKHKKSKGSQPSRERKNTAVYVTSIPLDADEDEVHYVFSKCGVVAEEVDSGKPRIKLYKDELGKFKGDALIVYFRPESVDLAIQMLDDSDFRLGVLGPNGKMRVQTADYSYKSQKEVPTNTNIREKKKIMRRTQKLNSKLADWDDDDPSTLVESSSRYNRIVILKHMFTLDELDSDPAALTEISEDIESECSKLGPVEAVTVFDLEPEGVVSVRFGNGEAAEQCVDTMNGRFFAGTKVEAAVASGPVRFRKRKEAEDVSEEDKRLEGFGKWLEADDSNGQHKKE